MKGQSPFWQEMEENAILPGQDLETEPGLRAEPGLQAETESKAQAGAKVQEKVQAGAKAEPETEVQAEPEAEVQAGAKAEPETEVQAEAETEVQPEPETEAQPEAGLYSNLQPEAGVRENRVPIDSSRFPDVAFAAYLSEAVDADRDGYLSETEISSVVSMDISGLGILDLKGIEVFTGLKSLDCSGNSLIELDLSALPALEEFRCEGNRRVVEADGDNRFTLPFVLADSAARIRNLHGASWEDGSEGGCLVASAQEVSYTYDTGSAFELSVTVSLEQFLRDISSASVGKIANVIYSGKAIKPAIALTCQGEKLSPAAYSISYKNNVNAGTAQITVTGKAPFKGTKQVSFRILPKSIKKLSCSKISKKTYTGKKIEPSIQLKDGSKKLKKNRDYTVTYKNNRQTGRATAKITGKGNYKGAIQRTFQILPRKVSAFKAGKRADVSITLKWKKSASISGYQVFQYQPKSKKYKKIKTLKAKSSSLAVKKLSPCTTYRFKIRAYKKSGKSTFYGAYSKVLKVQTKVAAPKMSAVSERKSQVRVSWTKVKEATGLELSYRKGNESFQKLSSVSRNETNTTYIFNCQEGAAYTFRMRAYRESGGKKDYGPYSQQTVVISSQGSVLSGGSYSPGSVYGPSLSQAELNQVREKVQYFKDHYIDDTMSDYMKVKMAHDYLVSVCSYAPSWALNRANTAWGALVYGEAQCSGYARAMKALCDGIGIGCYYVHADANASNPSHQWNEVCVNGKWYIIDVQCNDLSRFYAVFLVSDSTFARTFGMSWDRSSVPPCPEDYFHY
jgi:transglutaminase-like putative cysteine protease